MSSARKAEHRRPWRSLAFRVIAWYVVVFLASIAALVATAVPTVRRALDRADSVVVEDRVERHVAVLATGLPEYRAAVAHADALGVPLVPLRFRYNRGDTHNKHNENTTTHNTAGRSAGDLHLEVGAPRAPW